jgi:hypothetical protein
MFSFKKVSKSLSNYVRGPDGELTESPVRLYPLGEHKDATYEVQFFKENVGIVLQTSYDRSLTVVGRINDSAYKEIVDRHVSIGDILLEVGGKDMLREDFDEVMTYIKMLKKSKKGVRLKFFKPTRCSLSEYREIMRKRKVISTDQYGFSRTLEYMEEEQAVSLKNQHMYSEREEDWREYMEGLGGVDALKECGDHDDPVFLDQRDMIRRGVPANIRGRVWTRVSGCEVLAAAAPKDYYASLLKRCEGDDLCQSVKDEVEKDLSRTFPHHIFFASEPGMTALRHVLQAHALHNTAVGYCQSLNFVAGMLLLLVEEEKAFWLLITITQHIMPKNYYTRDMAGMYTDQNVLAHIVKTRMPKIHAIFERTMLQTSFVAVPWFMCIFMTCFRTEVALRVWDIFFNEGSSVLFRLTLALLKINEDKILLCKDGGEILTLMRECGLRIHDPDYLLSKTFRVAGLSSMMDDATILAESFAVGIEKAMGALGGRSRDVVGVAASATSATKKAASATAKATANAASATAMATAKASKAAATAMAQGFKGVVSRLRTSSTSSSKSSDDPNADLDLDDPMDKAIANIRRKSIALRSHVLENWQHGKVPPGMAAALNKSSSDDQRNRSGSGSGNGNGNGNDDVSLYLPDAEEFMSPSPKALDASGISEEEMRHIDSIQKLAMMASDESEESDSTYETSESEEDEDVTNESSGKEERTPQHYADFTEEEVREWRARYSGLLPRGALLGNDDEVQSPRPLFIDALSSALSSESPLPEAFRQYFEDPFSPVTPYPIGQDDMERNRSNSGASVTSTGSAGSTGSEKSSGKGAAVSGTSPGKPRQIKARRGSFLHRMASKGDKGTGTSMAAAMATAVASPEAATTAADMPLPVPVSVSMTPPLPTPPLWTPSSLTPSLSDMGGEATTAVEMKKPKKLSLSRRLSAAREETALHGNLSPAAKPPAAQPAAKGPPAAVARDAPVPEKAPRRRSLSDRLKKPPLSSLHP